MVYLTIGDKGGSGDPRALAATRRAEAEAAAGVIGASIHHGFAGDLELLDERMHRDLVMDFIRAAAPDLIITLAPVCAHPDHRITSRLVFNASYCSTIPNYPSPSGLPPYAVRAPIFYCDTVAGVDFHPEEYVDIVEVWDIKRKMIECHRSQVERMEGYRGVGLPAMAETLSRLRGIQCGVEFAEAFRKENAWGRVRPGRLLP
jgi:LmbE family N-acetylglucosaminyl deacetylase